MSKHVEMVPVAVVEGAGMAVATKVELPPVVDRGLVAQLVDDAQRQGLPVDGEGGLLAELPWLVLESALDGEITDHLGYGKHEKGASADGNAATAPGRRPCSRRLARSRSTCPGTVPERLSRRSSRSGSVGSGRLTTPPTRSSQFRF